MLGRTQGLQEMVNCYWRSAMACHQGSPANQATTRNWTEIRLLVDSHCWGTGYFEIKAYNKWDYAFVVTLNYSPSAEAFCIFCVAFFPFHSSSFPSPTLVISKIGFWIIIQNRILLFWLRKTDFFFISSNSLTIF